MTYFFWILWIWEWLQSSGKNSELRFCRPGFWPQLCYQPTVWHKVDLITPHSSFLTYKMKNLGQRQLRHLPVSKFYDLMKKYFVGLKHESPLNSNSFFFFTQQQQQKIQRYCNSGSQRKWDEIFHVQEIWIVWTFILHEFSLRSLKEKEKLQFKWCRQFYQPVHP